MYDNVCLLSTSREAMEETSASRCSPVRQLPRPVGRHRRAARHHPRQRRHSPLPSRKKATSPRESGCVVRKGRCRERVDAPSATLSRKGRTKFEMRFTKSQGLKISEQVLAELCKRSFLRLWTYPNLSKKPGKELTDLLVVFRDDVLIFSDKSCAFPDTGDAMLDWQRGGGRSVCLRQEIGCARSPL